jgi:hypothetical protein
MKKSLALFATVAAITGCQQEKTVVIPQGGNPPSATSEVTAKPTAAAVDYATLDASARQAVIAKELRVIGKAIKEYQAKNNGKWPDRLTMLVTAKLLPASALVSVSDPTGGKEGGVPDSYTQWQQSEETDEANCSFLYEFSGATAKWGWQTYLAGGASVTTAAVDTNKDGEVSWQEAKLWQLARGDTSQATPAPYPKNRFPVVRCYWYGHPDSNTRNRTVISLAADLETVFLSQPWWEKDTEPVIIP